MAPKKFSWLNIVALILLTGLAYFNFVRLTTADLNPDEAYYQELAQHLPVNLGENSPLTAFVIRGFTALGGANEFAIRLSALLSWSLLLLFVPLFTKAIYQDTTAAACGLITTLFTPALALNSPLITPDLLLIAFSLPTWYFFHQAIEEAKPTAWYPAGFFWGLTLLARFDAVLIGLAIVIMLLLRPSKWRLIRQKGPYLAALLGLLMFAPVWYWNCRHGWTGFSWGPFIWPGGPVPLQAAKQLGVTLFRAFTLFLLPLSYYTLKRLVTFRRTTGGEYFLIGAFLPPLLYWAYTGLIVPGQAPASLPPVVYLPALVFIAGQLYQGLQQPGLIKKTLLTGLIVVNLGLSWLMFVVIRQPSFLEHKVDYKLPARLLTGYVATANSTHGWSQLGHTIDRLISATFPEKPRVPVVAGSYQLAAELNYYVTAPVELFTDPTAARSYFDSITVRRVRQFDRQAGLLVVAKPVSTALNAYLSQIELMETVKLKHRGMVIRTVYVYRFARLNAAALAMEASDKPYVYPGLERK
jgi:4-amino-4-deoxy-L-arabinose transferase-like glycosyltransferase